jgi:hypothetical protein
VTLQASVGQESAGTYRITNLVDKNGISSSPNFLNISGRRRNKEGALS